MDLGLIACTPQAIREAEDVVAQADSLWHAGKQYGIDEGDSATLAQASPLEATSTNGDSETGIVIDPSGKKITVNGFPDGQIFYLYLYDNVGKYITSVNTYNPVDVRTLPNTVFYIEVMTDNQLVGAINIPLSVL